MCGCRCTQVRAMPKADTKRSPWLLSTIHTESVAHMIPDLADSACLVSQAAQPCLLPTGIISKWAATHSPSITNYMGSGDVSSGPQALMVYCLPAEPSPHHSLSHPSESCQGIRSSWTVEFGIWILDWDAHSTYMFQSKCIQSLKWAVSTILKTCINMRCFSSSERWHPLPSETCQCLILHCST